MTFLRLKNEFNANSTFPFWTWVRFTTVLFIYSMVHVISKVEEFNYNAKLVITGILKPRTHRSGQWVWTHQARYSAGVAVMVGSVAAGSNTAHCVCWVAATLPCRPAWNTERRCICCRPPSSQSLLLWNWHPSASIRASRIPWYGRFIIAGLVPACVDCLKHNMHADAIQIVESLPWLKPNTPNFLNFLKSNMFVTLIKLYTSEEDHGWLDVFD